MHIMPRKKQEKPLPYLKALTKIMDIIKKRKPKWDIFQVVGVAQILIRRNKQWIQSTDG